MIAGGRPTLTASDWRIWGLTAAGKYLEGLVVFMGGIALPLVQAELASARAAAGLLAAAPLIGILVGAPLLGTLADRWGRRPVFLAELVLLLAGLLGAAASPNVTCLVAALLLIGLALGADYPTGHLVISEQLPAAWRGPLVLGAFGCQAVGALSGSLLGWLLAAGGGLGPLGWRSLYLLPVLPVLLLTGARLGVPESPGWRPPGVAQAQAAAEGGSAAAAGQTQSVPAGPSPLAPQAARPQTYPSLRPLLLAGLPWFVQDLSTYGVGIFLPQLLVEGGVQRHSLGWATAADGLFVAGIGLAIVLVDRLGRIGLQVAGFAGCAAGLALAAWGCSGALQAPSLVIAGVGLFLFMTNAGPNATTYLLAGEVFPIAQRGQGAGLAAAAGKAGAVLAALTLPGLLHRWGTGAVLAGLAISSVIGALLTSWLRLDPALEPTESGRGTG